MCCTGGYCHTYMYYSASLNCHDGRALSSTYQILYSLMNLFFILTAYNYVFYFNSAFSKKCMLIGVSLQGQIFDDFFGKKHPQLSLTAAY